ncbi:hypothetical protein RIF29_18550 [Crotalaria pallida]|uniref:Uncharacterized protein n=1 Tax=Crotalaria pallida TaxID=3830 RepID=A0AAN9FKN1_CROPI
MFELNDSGTEYVVWELGYTTIYMVKFRNYVLFFTLYMMIVFIAFADNGFLIRIIALLYMYIAQQISASEVLIN